MIYKITTELDFKKKQIVYYENDLVDDIFIIKEGSFALYKTFFDRGIKKNHR